MDEAGHWVKFVVVRTEVTPQRPHGLRCSLTLHAPDGERLVGFDNTHPVRERRGPGTRRGLAIDLYYPFWSLLVDEFDAVAERLAETIRRRGCRFDTLEDFVELLLYTPIFTHTVPGVLELAARTTLRESADGKDYILRCPREYEARIIEFLRGFSPLVDFDRLPCPTKVVGSDPTLPNSFLPTIDLSLVVSVDYDFLPDTTHLLQLEKPSECVAEVRQFLERFGVL